LLVVDLFVIWSRLTVCCQTEDDDCEDGLDDANGQHPVQMVEAVRHVDIEMHTVTLE
jgi:hypothetical protein